MFRDIIRRSMGKTRLSSVDSFLFHAVYFLGCSLKFTLLQGFYMGVVLSGLAASRQLYQDTRKPFFSTWHIGDVELVPFEMVFSFALLSSANFLFHLLLRCCDESRAGIARSHGALRRSLASMLTYDRGEASTCMDIRSVFLAPFLMTYRENSPQYEDQILALDAAAVRERGAHCPSVKDTVKILLFSLRTSLQVACQLLILSVLESTVEPDASKKAAGIFIGFGVLIDLVAHIVGHQLEKCCHRNHRGILGERLISEGEGNTARP